MSRRSTRIATRKEEEKRKEPQEDLAEEEEPEARAPPRAKRSRAKTAKKAADAVAADPAPALRAKKAKKAKKAEDAPASVPAPVPAGPAADVLAACKVGGAAAAPIDAAPWPPACALRKLGGGSWRGVFACVSGDCGALLNLERTCKRARALADALTRSSPARPAAWRIAVNPKLAKRARDTLWRVARPSERMAEHLVAGTCCICARPWGGQVLDILGVYAHDKCARDRLVNVDFVVDPERDRHGVMGAALLGRLRARPLAAASWAHLPRVWLQGYNRWHGQTTYQAVWVSNSWMVPEHHALEAAADAADAGDDPAVHAARCAATAARIAVGRAAHGAAARRVAILARAKRRSSVEKHCASLPGGFAGIVASLGVVGTELAAIDAPAKSALLGDWLADVERANTIPMKEIKLRLTLVSALLSDADFVRSVPEHVKSEEGRFVTVLLSALKDCPKEEKAFSPALVARLKHAIVNAAPRRLPYVYDPREDY